MTVDKVDSRFMSLVATFGFKSFSSLIKDLQAPYAVYARSVTLRRRRHEGLLAPQLPARAGVWSQGVGCMMDEGTD